MKKRIAFMLACLMALSLVFTACAPTTAPTESAPKTEAPAAQESSTEDAPAEEAAPARTDLNLQFPKEFASTDAHGDRTVQEIVWKTQVYEPLYHFNENTLEFEPRLATGYTVSDDGLVYTFTLRDDVKFHNGDQMKASDVVFSYEHIRNTASWKSFWGCVDHVEAIDDFTVAIHLTGPTAAAMTNISQIWIESERAVTEGGETFGTEACLAGTGAYYIAEYNSQTNVRLEAFADYYRGEAAIKTINYKIIKDSASALMAFETGELDWYVAPIASWPSLTANPAYKTEVVPANHITYTFINYQSNEVLANDKVREAIAWAIDKEAMNLAAFDGLAVIADYMENPQFNVGAPEGDVVYSYNPEKSKELLAEAGYPDGVDIGVLTVTNTGHFPAVGQVLQQNLADVGITCEIQLLDSTAANPNYRAQMYDIGLTGYSNTGDYDSFRMRVASASVGSYFVKYEGDKFDWQYIDGLVDQQGKELDLEKRLEITKELNDYVMSTATMLPLLHKVSPCVWDKDLNVVNVPNFYEVYDWSWN